MPKWLWISDPVRPADVELAFRRLATVPLRRMTTDRHAEVTVTIPNDASWRRIVRNWGAPGYFIGAVSPGPKRSMYCLTDLGVRVEARIDNQPLNLEVADVPYGYSINCRPAGMLFRAPPGTAVQIRLVIAGQPLQAADLVIEPYWAFGTKDRLVGIGIEQQLHIRTFTTTLGVTGLFVLCLAVYLFSRRQLGAAG
jgi:hypothetical protein